MNIVDDYMLQKFPKLKGVDKGKLETNKPYQCRICWYTNNFPSFEKLSELTGTAKGTLHNYSSQYGWDDIKNHAIELQAKQDIIDLRNRQKKIESKHRRGNDKLWRVNEEYLDELLDDLTKPYLSDSYRENIIEEIRNTRNELSKIQRDERTTEHLPNSYKDLTADVKMESENTTTVSLQENITDKQKRAFIEKLQNLGQK